MNELNYTCALCGFPSASHLCLACDIEILDEPEYGPMNLYETLISEGFTDEDLIRMNERASMILESMKPVATRYKISK